MSAGTVIRAANDRSVRSVTAKPERKKSAQQWEFWLAVAIPLTAVIIDVLVRSTPVAFGVSLVAVGILIFTARSYQRVRRSLEITQQDQEIGGYTKAIEKLGSRRLEARIGGVFALERVALGSPRDHQTVMDVLADFIREHSHEEWPPRALEVAADDELELAADDDSEARTTRPDVQAAVTVIGRRNYRNDRQPVNLNRADFTAADLTDAQLSDVRLSDAVLTRAYLTSVDLADAQLIRVNLTQASLIRANLRDANLCAANLAVANLTEANLARSNLISAQLVRANLNNANLAGADLTDAQLVRANLTSANLRRADLTRTNLAGANFTGANLAGTNFTGADLSNALWPRESAVPKGWDLKSGSRRLERASADTGNPG